MATQTKNFKVKNGLDVSGAISATGCIAPGYLTTATAAGTTTLTASSAMQQFFTGTSAQTVKLPVTSTLILGQAFVIHNNSTNLLTIQSSGDNNIYIMVPGLTVTFTCILLTGTTAASWDYDIDGTSGATAPVSTSAQVDSYTLALSDAGKLVEMGKGTAQTLTVPTNTAAPFPVGTKIDVLQTGAGQVTIAGADGTVTINATPGLKISAQWGAASLVKRATNTWVAVGSLAA